MVVSVARLRSSRCPARARAGRHAERRVAARVTADRAALDISKMKPLADRVLVKPAEAESVTAGGVLLAAGAAKGPDAAQVGEHHQCMGKAVLSKFIPHVWRSDGTLVELTDIQVIEVGTKVELKLSKGDTVVYSKYGTSDVDASDGKIVFVRADSILGVCTE